MKTMFPLCSHSCLNRCLSTQVFLLWSCSSELQYRIATNNCYSIMCIVSFHVYCQKRSEPPYLPRKKGQLISWSSGFWWLVVFPFLDLIVVLRQFSKIKVRCMVEFRVHCIAPVESLGFTFSWLILYFQHI